MKSLKKKLKGILMAGLVSVGSIGSMVVPSTAQAGDSSDFWRSVLHVSIHVKEHKKNHHNNHHSNHHSNQFNTYSGSAYLANQRMIARRNARLAEIARIRAQRAHHDTHISIINYHH